MGSQDSSSRARPKARKIDARPSRVGREVLVIREDRVSAADRMVVILYRYADLLCANRSKALGEGVMDADVLAGVELHGALLCRPERPPFPASAGSGG